MEQHKFKNQGWKVNSSEQYASFPLYTGNCFVNAPENNMIGLHGIGLH